MPPPSTPVVCPADATATIDDLLTAGRTLLAGDKPAPAAACLELAARAASEGQLIAKEGVARLGLAQAAYGLADYPRAEEQANRAIEILKQTGDALNAARATRLKAAVLMFRGDRAGARSLQEAALAEFERLGADRDRATTLIGLANNLEGRDYDPSLLDTAIALARKAGDARTEGRALHSRADHHFSAGRFDEAARDLDAAIAIYQSTNDTDGLADAYVSMGRVQRAHGQPERAIDFYERAAALQQAAGDLRGQVQSINAKAIALAALGRTEEARREYEREYEIAKRTGSDRIITFAQGNLAPAYAAAGEHAKAIELLERVIAREQSPYVLAYRHASIADCYAAIGRLDQAQAHADQAVAFARQSNNRDYLPRVLWLRADVERRAGRSDEALGHAREAVSAIEDLRARLVPLDYMKRGFAETYQTTFGLTIALMLDKHLDTDALVTSEQARARAFLDLLASRDLLGAPAAPATPTTAATGRRDVALASYASASPASIDEITATARRLKSSLLSYWINSDELLIWVVSQDGAVRSARVPVTRSVLEKTVTAADPAAKSPDVAAFTRLYDWAVAPVSKYLPPAGSSIIIIPHGALFRVPFAALRNPHARKYLVEEYAISYAPSISSFALTHRLVSRTSTASGVLLVADPKSVGGASRGDDLPALAGSLREVSAVERALAPSRTVVLSGTGALEPIVRRTFTAKKVVHFATHAVVNDDAPLDSYLAVGAVGPEAAADGRLTVREIYDLSLDANLVFLSACRTATGKVSGDGISGLSRALFYAGTPTVIATLWDVADEPSARLAADFYRAWRNGMEKRAALRYAQLRMIKALRAGTLVAATPRGKVRLANKPVYWASYVLVGEP